MGEPVHLTPAEAECLASEVLQASGTLEAAARSTARALVAAEVDGHEGHGLSRVPSYAKQTRSGKVNGAAVPRATQVAPGALRVDAGLGFAYPAIDLAIAELVPLTRAQGIGVVAIHRSHHFGQVGAHAERLAQQGLIALIFGNTPKAMAFWGGRQAMLGTNPLAFASPWFTPGTTEATAPLVVDLALSVAARGRIVTAQRTGRSIPSSWAVDATGQPTTDPSRALTGTLLPIGGAKGGALALMVEILGAALTASSFGWEATSFFDAEGESPAMGHLFIAIDPGPLSGGGFGARMATLAQAFVSDPAVRLPGSSRLANRARAARDGITIDADLHAEIDTLLEAAAL